MAALLFSGTVIGGFAGGVAFRQWSEQPARAASPAASTESGRTNVALAVQGGTPASVYESASHAVVTVSVSSQRSRGTFSIPTEGEGSGFVVDEQGHILTNNHVVRGASNIIVTLFDGTQVSAKLVGSDPGSDLALLKADIPADRLTVATLGDSDLAVVGEPVVAIGAPFGLDQTLTAGVISALNRTFGEAGGRPMRGLIQTDAPINPGNSGGPLFNLQGEVIGITASIESPVRASVGIGFAIPINAAKRLLPDLASGGQVDHPWIGIRGMAITAQNAASAQLPVTKGVLVIETVAGGPAEAAGIKGSTTQPTDGSVPKGGDIISALDGSAVTSIEDISGYIDTKRVGDTVKIEVLRDGEAMQIEVKLGAWPSS